MSRRRSFRVELGGLLPEARSLEFESGLVVQISDVSPEINESALPSAEASGKAAQSALTAGPLSPQPTTIPRTPCSREAPLPPVNWQTRFRAGRLVIMKQRSELRE